MAMAAESLGGRGRSALRRWGPRPRLHLGRPNHDRTSVRGERRPLKVALPIPLRGPAGIWGPSCQSCAQLGAAEINQAGGVLGREIELVTVDAGAEPDAVAQATDRLLATGEIEAVVGMHISAVRQALAQVIAGRVPYVYTPLYEGGERARAVFAIGETPDRQLRPAIHWLSTRRRARRWVLLGNDYIWPRVSHRLVRDYVAADGGRVIDDIYLPFGHRDVDPVLDRLVRARPDVVLISLVGQDAVTFNRAFADAGLAGRVLRLSTAIEENALLAIGADRTENLYAAAGYFANLDTTANRAFVERYRTLFGDHAPVLNALGQSCYEGLKCLHALAAQIGTTDAGRLARRAEGTAYLGARGAMRLAKGGVDQPIFLAEAQGHDFHIVKRF